MPLDFRKWAEEDFKRRPRRASTRWVLAAGLALLIALPVIEMMSPGDPSRVFPNVMPMAMLLVIASMMSPFSREAIFTERGLSTYDEFERGALLAALRRSYLVLLLVVAALFVWLALGTRFGWPLPTLARQWTAIGFALLIAMLALPATFAEFMVPMPDPDDDYL